MRWLGFLVPIGLCLLLSGFGLAAEPGGGADPLIPPLALGSPCGLIGECARFDALGVHLTGTAGVARAEPGALLLRGRVRGSVSLLDALEVSLALGGEHRRAQPAPQTERSVLPLGLGVRLRLWPWLDLAGPDLALTMTRAVEMPGLGATTALGEDTGLHLAGSHSGQLVDVDGSGGLLWHDSARKPAAVRLTASAFVRLHETPDPTLPRDTYRVGVQAVADFPLGAVQRPSRLHGLAVFEVATDRGFRFQVGGGVSSEPQRLGYLGLVQFTGSWGLRYRTAESRAGDLPWMPVFLANYFYTDPVLEADGCIYTDPSAIGRMKIVCVGKPDPMDLRTIVHHDGRRYPVGTHVWIDKDGTLLTQSRQIVAKLDARTTMVATAFQKLAEYLNQREQESDTPCAVKGGMLHAVTDPSFAAVLALDDLGGGVALLGQELARSISCGRDVLGGGLPPFLPLGKKLGNTVRSRSQQLADVIEHDRPPSPPSQPPGTAAQKAAQVAQDSCILCDNSRGHIFRGDVDPKTGKARGWHFEATGDKSKGTQLLEGTVSPPDQHGVYEGNVLIEGVKKDARSTFFPKDWTDKQVESAIEEAYKTRKREPRSGEYRGSSSAGMDVILRLDAKDRIESAYPAYEGPKYQGPKK